MSRVAKAGKKSEKLDRMHVQWAVNEKVAFEIAYTGSIAGLRTAVTGFLSSSPASLYGCPVL